MSGVFEINGRRIGPGLPTYIIAEMSANHNQDLAQAVKIIEAAKAAGADAVKLQTYTADTLTIDCNNEYFQIRGHAMGRAHVSRSVQQAFTPWEWHAPLKELANNLGLDFFSTPFDATAVEFLERLGRASVQDRLVRADRPALAARSCATRKPIIMSTGMATFDEIAEAVRTMREAAGASWRCSSAPAPTRRPPEEMHLRTIPHLAAAFDVPVGLSDHTLGIAVPVAAVALGAPASSRSISPCRAPTGPGQRVLAGARRIHGRWWTPYGSPNGRSATVHYGTSPDEEARAACFAARSSWYETFAPARRSPPSNVRSIRPGHGLHTRHLDEVLDASRLRDIARGTPLAGPSGR